MRKLSTKSLVLLLLLVIACCNSIDLCEGRRGRHWRPKKGPASSLTKKKGKGKPGSQHNGQGSPKPSMAPKPAVKQNPNLKPKPSPAQNPKPNPNPGYGPSPTQGKANPASPTPIIYNVVDFGAQGDAICDDTKVCLPIYIYILHFAVCCYVLWEHFQNLCHNMYTS